MTLIQCPECGTEVSDAAQQCPKCAYPVASAAAAGPAAGRSPSARVQTIEETSKALKLQQLLAVLLIIVSIISCAISVSSVTDSGGTEAGTTAISISGLLFFAGLAWLIIIKFRIWWHHK